MRGEFHLVLAGGNTPRTRTVYRALAREAHDWPRWHIWFGDERCLPPNHPERNSAMARAAALAYAEELARVPAFDLVLLGLGEDGHSASLFPGHTAEQEANVLAVFDAPNPPPERVSFSARRLSRARHVLFLAACRTLVVDSENRPRRGEFLLDLPPHSPAMGQKAGEKWTAAVDLQPTIPKFDRLLVSGAGKHGALRRWRASKPVVTTAFSTAVATIPAATIQPEAGVDVLLAPEPSSPGVFS